ncbi:MAG: glycosyltransferase family 39 protein [Acidobacteriota bacterium]|nr:glycosyltransferase family 39 protein [Acidobacteriota bacterium]
MFSPSQKRWLLAIAAAGALFCLYFFGLTDTGLLGPDEPRYAAIGRDMARNHDWITPRLWGDPWFEKPPLLYWMTALGFACGLDQDLAPRLPVALLSVAFLAFFWFAVRREFEERVAWFAAGILATSAGWLAFSLVAVTDLPLAACFSAAMLMLIGDRRRPIWAGVFLGAAVLAKGLVPLVLIVPALWFLRKRPIEILSISGAAALIAMPWYLAVTILHGRAFLDEFLWKHHLGRFLTPDLQHVQPWWYFLPVLLAGLFPWTPTLFLILKKRVYDDPRTRFLLAWLAWGLVFFSCSRNKLPGYILPLLPAAALLIGIALAHAGRAAAWTLAAAAAFLALIPVIQDILPRALLSGLTRAPFQFPLAALFPALGLAALCFLLERSGRRALAVALICGIVTVSVVLIIRQTVPGLDHMVSARAFWRSQQATGKALTICVDSENRSWRYGLDYYAGRQVLDCNPE